MQGAKPRWSTYALLVRRSLPGLGLHGGQNLALHAVLGQLDLSVNAEIEVDRARRLMVSMMLSSSSPALTIWITWSLVSAGPLGFLGAAGAVDFDVLGELEVEEVDLVPALLAVLEAVAPELPAGFADFAVAVSAAAELEVSAAARFLGWSRSVL
jgi:hypothetical protein